MVIGVLAFIFIVCVFIPGSVLLGILVDPGFFWLLLVPGVLIFAGLATVLVVALVKARKRKTIITR